MAKTEIGARSASENPNSWNDAAVKYDAERRKLDLMPAEDPGIDAQVDSWCAAMDDLFQAPAPNAGEIIFKMGLLEERYIRDGFAIPNVDWEALRRDVVALGREGR